MVLNCIFVGLVTLVAYLWYPSNEHNLLVLVNTNTFSMSSLKKIKHLKAAFKISRNIYYDERKEEKDNAIAKVIISYKNNRSRSCLIEFLNILGIKHI